MKENIQEILRYTHISGFATFEFFSAMLLKIQVVLRVCASSRGKQLPAFRIFELQSSAVLMSARRTVYWRGTGLLRIIWMI
jgi:hypothetical protein